MVARRSRLRVGLLLALLALSLVALGKRNRVRGWLWGVDAEARQTPGGPAPELPATARTLDGARLTLAGLRGKVVLVHFWTFACSNCEHMLPRYADWHARYAQHGLAIVGVHSPETDGERDEARLRQHVASRGIRWPVVVDSDFTIWDAYRVQAWPTVVLADRQGRIQARFVGDDQSAEIATAIERLLGP